jgi:glycosyltransferase involved in cell wall biosynthesis
LPSNIRVLASPASYFISDQTGSDPGVAYGLLSSLSAYPLSVYAVTNRSKIRKTLPSSIKILTADIDLKGSALEQALFYLKSYRLGRKLVSSFRPDVIHQMSGIAFESSFSPLALFGNISDIPFVIGPASHNIPIPPEIAEETRGVRWGRSWTDLRSPRELALQKLYEKMLVATKLGRRVLFEETLNRASAIVTVNEFTRKAYSKIVDPRKIVVIPLGVDAEEFSWTQTNQSYNILAIGQLFVRKGFAFLITAMSRVLRNFPGAQLHVVGTGPQHPNLVALAQSLGIGDHVHFHGYVERAMLPGLFASCRLTCLPVLEEAFGLATLEAMSVGRPVISTNAVGPAELVKDGRTGFLVPAADADALAERIIDLLSDEELTRIMGLSGRKEVEEKYDWKVVAKQYFDLYERLAA